MNKITIAVVIFLIVGGYIIVSSQNLDLEDKGDQKTFLKTFGRWVVGVGKNIKDVAGYAVKEHDWLPNQTNETGDYSEDAP